MLPYCIVLKLHTDYRMEGVVDRPNELVNTEPDKNESWLWVEEHEIEQWIEKGEKVFQPLVNYYLNRSKKDWPQGSVRDRP